MYTSLNPRENHPLARSLARSAVSYLVRHQGSSNSSGVAPRARSLAPRALRYGAASVCVGANVNGAARSRSLATHNFAFALSRNLSAFSLPPGRSASRRLLLPLKRGCYPCRARDGGDSHTAKHTCATRSHLRPARPLVIRGRGKGEGRWRTRVGGRPTNRPAGYAGYGQLEGARSQVYPGTPTLAVAPSRIDFNPSSRAPQWRTRTRITSERPS